MLVVLLLLPIYLAVDDGKFDHCGGERQRQRQRGQQWTTIGGESGRQREC
jgi:hypothetical protein